MVMMSHIFRVIPNLGKIRRCITIIAVISFGHVAFADQSLEDEYQISVGDTLRVSVFGHDDLSKECQIDNSGRCSLPLINYVDAAGLTAPQLEQVVIASLKPDYLKDPQVRVEVTGFRPIYVLGEVNNPGGYPYSIGITVANAVALAGGYTFRASRRKISVTHAEQDEAEKQRISEQYELIPGDVIEIPERFF